MHRLLTLLPALLLAATGLRAQSPQANTAFKSGETLVYDLYFNWKFVWIKVGSASMNVTDARYRGQSAWRAYLQTRGSRQADRYFVMRDTLMAYTTRDLVPLYYSKRAHEGKRRYRDEAVYSYADGRCNVRMSRHRQGRDPESADFSSRENVYDMISMMLRARSFDATSYKPGHRIPFLMADGRKCERQTLVYRGKKKFKMEHTGITYRCLVFSFVEQKDGKERDVVTFYITDDRNHLPVRLDMNLTFGTAKAFLTGASGVRNPQTAIVR